MNSVACENYHSRMGDFTGLIVLLLPLAAATGWFVARQSSPREEQDAPAASGSDYVRGISHLVNNDTDEAIEIFIGLMDTDEATVDLHLALGSLFRRRGEVDRALRIHQNLVQRPELKPISRNQARFELAKDYLAAGVLDRAEDIFLELAHQGMFLSDCLRRLMRIYEGEREWDKAIDAAQWLGSAKAQDMGSTIAQYYCEKAESAARQEDRRGRQHFLKKALAADPHCVRAQCIRAQQALDGGRPDQAIKYYRDILRHHEEFVPEILLGWRQACVELKGEDHWVEELQQLCSRHFNPWLQVALIEALDRSGNAGAGQVGTVLDTLAQKPSWIGLQALLARDWAGLPDDLRALLQQMSETLKQAMNQSAHYLCVQCGYSSRTLNWQCPSCQHWNSTQPLPDLHAGAFQAPAAPASSLQNRISERDSETQ